MNQIRDLILHQLVGNTIPFTFKVKYEVAGSENAL